VYSAPASPFINVSAVLEFNVIIWLGLLSQSIVYVPDITPLSYMEGLTLPASNEKLELIELPPELPDASEPVKYVGRDSVCIPTELLFISRYSALKVSNESA